MTPPYGPEFDDDPEPRGPSRALVGAWMALAAVLGLAVGYAVVSGTPDRLGERTAYSTSLPPVAEPDGGGSTSGSDTTASRPLTPEGGVPLRPLRDTTVDSPAAPEVGVPADTGSQSGDAARTPTPQAPAVPTEVAGTEPPAIPEQAGQNTPQQPASDEAWRRHARDAAGVPAGFDRIAVVVRGLGLKRAVTKRAIAELPGAVSLSFSPYGSQLDAWMQRAREAGHELLMDLPMQPKGFPVPDPGGMALKLKADPARNLERLENVLGAGDSLVGAVARWGSAFVERRQAVAPILRDLKKRGLIYVANGRSRSDVTAEVAGEIELPHLSADAILDRRPISRAVVDSWLAAAERIAQDSGLALVLVNAYPMTLDALTRWSQTLKARGIALVPVSAALAQPAAEQAARLR
ncbi:divergent polysaccharide deacetylase family protein [Limimonas halophila]|uniref:divergent polysaccharide deacetylase family protein n=1 Tax=Limimonas halophila TaxID=1082479 RepID=UPI0015A400E2|nr:divergent polysaccharide deacetylase family protein [Limimonas halophila]